jgi:hypothetical protein
VIVTAGVVERAFLEPGLEAVALNRQQQRLLYDPSPAVDSALEHLLALWRLAGPPSSPQGSPDVAAHVTATLSLGRRLASSNAREREHVRAVCGEADRLTRDLRFAERVAADAGLSAKAIARQVRAPLTVLEGRDPDDQWAVVDAVFALDLVFAAVPAAQLFSPAVRHELRGRRFALLRELYERRRGAHVKQGAGALATPGARPTDAARECPNGSA